MTVGIPLEMMIKGEIIMEIDTSNLTDEQISKLSEFVHSMENENRKAQKWWIMPNFDCFEQYNPSIGLNYFVEPQKDSYSRSKPPLKSDFESKEAAEKWLKEYLETKEDFEPALNDVNELIFNLNRIREKLRMFEKITRDEWKACFKDFEESLNHGSLNKVTKDQQDDKLKGE
jgi:hypothetical protein